MQERRRPRVRILLLVIVGVSATLSTMAMRRTSTTFDEIVLMAGGTRGFETGRFDLAPEHPPLTQYLYGLPIFLYGANYPKELGKVAEPGFRYVYAQEFFWQSGNDPERLAFLGRLMGVACAAALVVATFLFLRPFGDTAAVMGALLVAFLPDMMAHSGVAYNDVPLALALFVAIYAIDRAIRVPTLKHAAGAGIMIALALSIKFSAIVLVPITGAVLIAEGMRRNLDFRWLRAVSLALFAGVLACYLALVVVYRGDFVLKDFIYGLRFTFTHVSEGHGTPGYLLGQFNSTGWWYFYPLAFVYKTPAALHVLAALSLLVFAAKAPQFRELLASRLRAPFIGMLVFVGALLAARLDIGFRYALPALPLLCVLLAVAWDRLWQNAKPLMRVVLVVLPLWYAGSTIAYYPHFLSYISEYGPGKQSGDRVLLDSSLDWGQGLLELRDYMRAQKIDRVFLSYFGSALPEGYGINYFPLASFFRLPSKGPWPEPEEAPKWVVISATNLHGVYVGRQTFARFRPLQPDTVLANTLFVYRVKS
jgi:dolichyl-phosphate-mannose-protein mannosyltransferase